MREDEKLEVYVLLDGVDSEYILAQLKSQYPSEYYAYISSKDGDLDCAFSVPVQGSVDLKGKIENIEFEDTIDGDTLQRAIENKRELYAEYYSIYNKSIADLYIESEDQVFISKYTPMLIAKMTKSAILSSIKDDRVIGIEQFNPYTIIDEMAIANQTTKAAYVRDTLGNKGVGVKIGQFESAVPNPNDAYLTGHNITNQSAYTPSMSSHATEVARILIGTTYGVAPSASLYSVGTSNYDGSFYAAIEWLLGCGVNIINISAHVTILNDSYLQPGTYDIFSRWMDHIAIQHDVHVVAAAGNATGDESTLYVGSPAMAYNVIAVGGYNTNNTVTDTDDTIYALTSFLEQSGNPRPEKPNLIAPAVNIHFGNTNVGSGTSFATPQVAGVVAQLCSKKPELKTKQTAMGAILAASSALKIDGANGSGYIGDVFYNTAITSQISDMEGAGKLNAYNARNVVHQNHYWGGQVAASSFPYTKSFYIDTSFNSINRVAVFWLKGNKITGSHSEAIPSVSNSPLDKLKLEVFDPDGNSLGSCHTTYGNYDIVQFVPPKSGNYTIKVSIIGGASNTVEYLGIALW